MIKKHVFPCLLQVGLLITLRDTLSIFCKVIEKPDTSIATKNCYSSPKEKYMCL